MSLAVSFDQLEPLQENTETTVWYGVRRRDNRGVIVKQAKTATRAQARARLGRELALLEELSLPGLLKPIALEERDDEVYLISEGMEGVTLRTWSEAGVSIDELFVVAVHLARTVGRLHEKMIVIGNLSPDTILIEPATGRTVLLDLSRARRLERGYLEVSGAAPPIGDMSCMAPEQTGQTNRVLDSRADLYALGAIFYTLLSGGKPPFPPAGRREMVAAILSEPPQPLIHPFQPLPEMLAGLIDKLMAKDPRARYLGSFGLIADLERCRRSWNREGRIETFTLGISDIPARLRFPSTLIGRDEEMRRLDESLEAVDRGMGRLVLLTGESGIGKTALIQWLIDAAETRGWGVAVGHCEPKRQSRPYAGLIRAARNLVHRLRQNPETSLATWRERLRKALRGHGRPLLEAVPDLARLMGEDILLDVDGTSSDGTVQRFTEVICRLGEPDAPFMLVLEDLHWSDEATRALLDRLTSRLGETHLLVVGSWDEPADRGTARYLELTERIENPAVLDHVRLSGLLDADVTALCTTMLGRKGEETAILARLLHDKTGGNPLHLHGLMTRLHREGSITLDMATGRWQWDIGRLMRRLESDDAREPVRYLLATLPPTVRYLLGYAACVGRMFSCAKLGAAAEMNPDACVDGLEQALLEGVITDPGGKPSEIDGSDKTFRFSHETLQRVALETLTRRQREEAHLRLGRSEKEVCGFDLDIFDRVDHLCQAHSMIDRGPEREALASLALRAARQAISVHALEAASRLLAHGAEMVGPESKADHIRRMIRVEQARCALARGRFVEARRHYEALVREGVTANENTVLGVEVHTALGDAARALTLARDGAAKLGLELPRRPSRLRLLGAMLCVVSGRFGGTGKHQRETADLLDLLLATSASARALDMNLWCWIMLRATALGYRHDRLSAAPFADLLKALPLTRLRATLPWARRLVRKARRRTREANDPRWRGRAELLSALLAPLSGYGESTVTGCGEALRENLDAGQLDEVGIAMIAMIHGKLAGGCDLAELEALVWRLQRTAPDTPEVTELIEITRDWISGLRKPIGAESLFDGRDPGPSKRFLRKGNADLFRMLRLQLAVITGETAAAREDVEVLESRVLPMSDLRFFDPDLALFRGLLVTIEPNRTLRARLGELALVESRLDRLCHFDPIATAPRRALISAERARLNREPERASRQFERAIQGFHELGAVHLEALALERAHEADLARGATVSAETALRTAHRCWQRWGAHSHCEALCVRHAYLREERDRPTLPGDSGELEALANAARGLSLETNRIQLSGKIMAYLLEQAGVAHGYLIREDRTAGLVVFAREPGERLSHPLPLRAVTTIDQDLVAAVTRARRFRVGVDPRNGEVLCLPFLVGNEIIAYGYLIQKAPGSFSSESLTRLEILAGQIAIALENERLCGNLEEDTQSLREAVSEQRAALERAESELDEARSDIKRAHAQMIHQEKWATMGAMASGIAHELKHPLNFIDNFASIIGADSREALATLERYRNAIPPEDWSQLREALVDSRGNARLIQLHGARINEIADSMLSFTVRSSNLKENHSLNEVVREYAEIAYRGQLSVNSCDQLIWRLELDPEVGGLQLVRQDLGRALVNLLNNAFEAAKSRRREQVERPEVSLTTNHLVDAVELRIRDNGEGIAPEIRPKIFKPFFTTKPKGIGLGLAITRDIICKQHGADLRLNTLPDGGTEAIVLFPK